MKESPFITFWRAINQARTECGAPELTFGPAMDAWQEVIASAMFDRDMAALHGLRMIASTPISSMDMVRQAAADAEALLPDQVAG